MANNEPYIYYIYTHLLVCGFFLENVKKIIETIIIFKIYLVKYAKCLIDKISLKKRLSATV